MNRKETNKLLKENKELRRRLEAANARIRQLEGSDSYHMGADWATATARRISCSKSYTEYLLRSLRACALYDRIRSAVRIFARFRIASAVMRAFTYAVTLIEAGAHIVILSTLSLIFLPITAILSVATLLISYVGCGRANADLRSLPEGKSVYVFFPEKRVLTRNAGFFTDWIGELSQSSENVIFIVSPSFWKRRGYKSGRYYLHYRYEAHNVIILRKYYYFSLRSHVIDVADAKSITLIY